MQKYFLKYPKTPYGKKSSVIFNDYRYAKAKEQAKLPIKSVDTIIEYINEFLLSIGINKVENPIYDPQKIDYIDIKNKFKLDDIRDIVWLKFTTDGYCGVVATSNDINFQIPKSKTDYNLKIRKYNSSGILIFKLHKNWDNSFVLIFPLHNIPKKYSRGDIERGIGNYLISKDVPIIDFYSHNY